MVWAIYWIRLSRWLGFNRGKEPNDDRNHQTAQAGKSD